VGKQVPHRGRPATGLGRDQPDRAQVVAGGCIKVHHALLAQLHHGDGGEGLGDRADARRHLSSGTVNTLVTDVKAAQGLAMRADGTFLVVDEGSGDIRVATGC